MAASDIRFQLREVYRQQTPPPQLIVIASPVKDIRILVGSAISPVSQTMLSIPLETRRSRLKALLQPIFSMTPPSVQQSPQLQLPVTSGGAPLNSPASSCTTTYESPGRQFTSNVNEPPVPSPAISAIRNKLIIPVLRSSYKNKIRPFDISRPVLALEPFGLP